jgi:hypothetical protein
MCFFCSSSGAVTAETRLYVTVPLHVLVVDSPVGVDVVTEVGRVGPFAQASLDDLLVDVRFGVIA